MSTDTYAEQRPGTAVVVVGYFAHCLIIIHGHPANKTSKQSKVSNATAYGRDRSAFSKKFPHGTTKAVACLQVSLLFDQC